MKNNTLSYRVDQLEKQVDKLDGRIEKLMENDLPHLQQDIASMKSRITVLTGVNLTAIIIALLVSILLR